MKNNYLTVEELIEKLQQLPPDAIPMIEEIRGVNHFTFAKDWFSSIESEETPQLGYDNNIDIKSHGEMIEDDWEWNVKFYIIAQI